MGKRVLWIFGGAFAALLMFLWGCWFYAGTISSDKECAKAVLERNGGLSLADFWVEVYEDTHGGPHGDGDTVAILRYDPLQYEEDGRKICVGEGWIDVQIPMNESAAYLEKKIGRAPVNFRVGYQDPDGCYDKLYINWRRPKNAFSWNLSVCMVDEDLGVVAFYEADT